MTYRITATLTRADETTHTSTELTALELGGEWVLDLTRVNDPTVVAQLVLVITPLEDAQ